ncbi:MAG: hypothetical protein K2X38_23665 [Gemmataceae bacterium]|nr:hypothetical protein [Gemmataceae bacterium]
MMKDSARYAKIVEWSEEDQCYIGSAPGLLFGGCHGVDEQKVFEELCRIADETIELYREDGKPPPTCDRDVRRAKALVFSGCESHPAAWSF